MLSMKILILEDDKRLAEELCEYLETEGFEAAWAEKPSAAFILLSRNRFDIALIDLKLPEYDGIEFLKRLKAKYPLVEAIIMSGHGDMESVIEALRHGAFDYLKKPFSPVEIKMGIARTGKYLSAMRDNDELKRMCESLRRDVVSEGDIRLIGNSEAVRNVSALIEVAGKNPDTPVLVTGESGTGKELVARLIHLSSGRKGGRFQAVNCAAVPNELFESEFFGYERGAFTDAKSSRNGFFRAADGGTLFLDEVGELSLQQQTKLLRVIEDSQVRPVGSDDSVPVDVRIVCATNRDLKELMDEGRFRLDLYYRLSVLVIGVPPLRERPEDIPLLIDFFLDSLCGRMGRKRLTVDPASVSALCSYSFPGNVRELRNMVERAVIAGSEPVRIPLPASFEHRDSPAAGSPVLVLAELERGAILKALELEGGIRTRAAHLLGITRQALERKIEKHGITLRS